MLDPATRRNRQQVRKRLADGFLEFGSSGRTWTRNTIIDLLAAENAVLPPAIEDFRCALLADGVALVTYRTVRTDSRSGEVMASLRSSVWMFESGSWRMRFHQGTRTPA